MHGTMSLTITSPTPEAREQTNGRLPVDAERPLLAGLKTDDRPVVAQIVRSLEVGGGEMMAARLAERLDRNRFRSVVFCLQEPGWLARELMARGTRVVVFDAGEGVKPGLVSRLWAALRSEGVDIVQCHNTMPLLYGGMAAALPNRGLRRPALLITKHGMTFWRGWRQSMVARSLLRRATVVAVSDQIRSAMVAGRWSDGARVRTILNGIDPERYRPGDGRAAVRRELGLPADAFVAGIVARLSPEKDHANLLRAFALASPRMPGARLVVVGDGPLREELENQAREAGIGDRCVFAGERQDVPRLLAALDLFVLSSTREGTPLTLLEAMASEVSTVTTAVGGIPKVVVPGQTGLLVPPSDPAALADAMAQMFLDPGTRERMGKLGRQVVIDDYSIDRMARDYEGLYEQILRRQ